MLALARSAAERFTVTPATGAAPVLCHISTRVFEPASKPTGPSVHGFPAESVTPVTFVVVPAWTATVATSALPAPDAIGTVRLEAAAGVPPVRCFTSAMPRRRRRRRRRRGSREVVGLHVEGPAQGIGRRDGDLRSVDADLQEVEDLVDRRGPCGSAARTPADGVRPTDRVRHRRPTPGGGLQARSSSAGHVRDKAVVTRLDVARVVVRVTAEPDVHPVPRQQALEAVRVRAARCPTARSRSTSTSGNGRTRT